MKEDNGPLGMRFHLLAELRQKLTGWRDDPDLAGRREPGALEKLSVEERKERLALWREVEARLSRTANR